MKKSEPIGCSALSQKEASEDKLQLNSEQEDNSKQEEVVKKHQDGGGENITVPFFGGNLSLDQVLEMQRKARKKSKLPARVIEPGMKSNRILNNLNKSERINVASTSAFPGNSPSSCEKNLRKCEEEQKPIEKLDEACHTAREMRSGFETNKSPSKKSNLNSNSVSTEKPQKLIGKTKFENGGGESRMKNQSKTYLEQYRKRKGKERTNSPGSKSICSSQSQFSLDLSSTVHTDIERVSQIGSSCLCHSSSEERLYREIIDSDGKTHSSAKSSFTSCKSTLGSNEGLNGDNSGARSIKSDDCGSKKNVGDEESAKKRTKTSTKLEKIPPVPRLARSLGPDVDSIKPKLTALQKRKEYGNKMSYINRENNQQKHTSDGNRVQNPSSNDEDGVEIPIIEYTIDQFDSSKLLKKPSKQIQKRKTRINTTKKIQKTADLEDLTDLEEVKLMIQRHEEEKRLAENIKHQLLLK